MSWKDEDNRRTVKHCIYPNQLHWSFDATINIKPSRAPMCNKVECGKQIFFLNPDSRLSHTMVGKCHQIEQQDAQCTFRFNVQPSQQNSWRSYSVSFHDLKITKVFSVSFCGHTLYLTCLEALLLNSLFHITQLVRQVTPGPRSTCIWLWCHPHRIFCTWINNNILTKENFIWWDDLGSCLVGSAASHDKLKKYATTLPSCHYKSLHITCFRHRLRDKGFT